VVEVRGGDAEKERCDGRVRVGEGSRMSGREELKRGLSSESSGNDPKFLSTLLRSSHGLNMIVAQQTHARTQEIDNNETSRAKAS
jgi:hypothetical protein